MPAHACWVCSPQLQRRAGGGGGQLSRVLAAFLPFSHKPGQRGSEGALVPLRVGMETTLLVAAAGASCLCLLCPVCRPWHRKCQVPARSLSANMEEAQSWIWGSLSYLQPLNRQSVLARKVLCLLHSYINKLGNFSL